MSVKLDAAAQLQAVVEPCKVDPMFKVKGPVMYAAILERVTSKKDKIKRVLVTIDYRDLLVSNPAGEVSRRLPLATMTQVVVGKITHKVQGPIYQLLIRAMKETTNEEIDLVLNFVRHEKTLPPCIDSNYFIECLVTGVKITSNKQLPVEAVEGPVVPKANLRKASSMSVKGHSFRRQPVPSEIHTEGESEPASPSPWILIRHKASRLHVSVLDDGRAILSNSSPASFRVEQHDNEPQGSQLVHQGGSYIVSADIPWENSAFSGVNLGKKNNRLVWHLAKNGVLWELGQGLAVRPLGNVPPGDGHLLELTEDATDEDIQNMAMEFVPVGIPSVLLEQQRAKQQLIEKQQRDDEEEKMRHQQEILEQQRKHSELLREKSKQNLEAQMKHEEELVKLESAKLDAQRVHEEEMKRKELAETEQLLKQQREEAQKDDLESEKRRLENEQKQGQELKQNAESENEKMRQLMQKQHEEEMQKLKEEIKEEQQKEMRELQGERERLKVAKREREERELQREREEHEQEKEYHRMRERERQHGQFKRSNLGSKKSKGSYEQSVGDKSEMRSVTKKEETLRSHSQTLTILESMASESGYATESETSHSLRNPEEREAMLCHGYQQFFRKHDKSKTHMADALAKQATRNEARAYRELLQKYPSCPIKDADFLRPDAMGDIKREVKYLRELIEGMKPKEFGKPAVKDNKYLMLAGTPKEAMSPWNNKPVPVSPLAPNNCQSPLLPHHQRADPDRNPYYRDVPTYQEMHPYQNKSAPTNYFGQDTQTKPVPPPETIRWAAPHIYASGSSLPPSFAYGNHTATQTPPRTGSGGYLTTTTTIQRTTHQTQQTQAPSEKSSIAAFNPSSRLNAGPVPRTHRLSASPVEIPSESGAWRPKDWTYIDRGNEPL